MKAIFIDDEILIRKGLSSIIPWKDYGFDTLMEAENGEEAYRLIREEKPELLLLDIRLPDTDGIEVAKTLRRDGNPCRIIIISGYSDFEYARSAIDCDVTSYLLKPVDTGELISSVKKACEEIRSRRLLSTYQPESEQAFSSQILRDLINGVIPYTYGLDDALIYDQYANITAVAPLSDHSAADSFPTHSENLDPRHMTVSDQILCYVSASPKETSDIHEFIRLHVLGSSDPVFVIFGSVLHSGSQLAEEFRRIREAVKNSFYLYSPGKIYSLNAPVSDRQEFVLPANISAAVNAALGGKQKELNEYITEFFASVASRKSPENLAEMICVNYFEQICEKLVEYYPRLQHSLPSREALLEEVSRHRFLYEYDQLFRRYFLDAAKIIENSRKESVITSVLAYIRQNLEKPLRLQDIADHFGYNTNYLGRLITKETGKSFNQLINQIRIEYACELLAQGISVPDASLRCGYSSQVYFGQIFRKVTGRTPADYRKEKIRKSSAPILPSAAASDRT